MIGAALNAPSAFSPRRSLSNLDLSVSMHGMPCAQDLPRSGISGQCMHAPSLNTGMTALRSAWDHREQLVLTCLDLLCAAGLAVRSIVQAAKFLYLPSTPQHPASPPGLPPRHATCSAHDHCHAVSVRVVLQRLVLVSVGRCAQLQKGRCPNTV